MGKKTVRGEWDSPVMLEANNLFTFRVFPVEFVLACVGYAVGLGNVWRFPYLVYENGGAAFLIPYAISLFIAGLPIFYLELCLGQFSSLGPNCIFGKIVPVLQGVGWAMVTVSFLVSIYYNMIIAWIIIYFAHSFRGTMLWSSCDNYWNTPSCQSDLDDSRCATQLGLTSNQSKLAAFFNGTCFIMTNTNKVNVRDDYFALGASKTGSAEEFFERYILNKADGLESPGAMDMNFMLVAGLFAAWVVIALCLIKGVKSTGKVVYITATFPYIVLVILLIRGLTLDGMWQGLKYYIFDPKIDKILQLTVWQKAATQIFYSLGTGFGGLLTMASYNKFHNNCFRDAVFVSLFNCGSSIFAGFAIFSILGFMAKQQGVHISAVVQSGRSLRGEEKKVGCGAGLAFIAYPEAISRMPAPYFWAILFFFMLFTLGLDSQFAMVETVTTAIFDQFPSTRRLESLVVILVCFVMFLIGLLMCTRAGVFYLYIFNDYSASSSLILIALFELIVVIYIYGLNKIIDDIEMMLGIPKSLISWICGSTGWYYRMAWMILSPLFLLTIFITSVIGQFTYVMTYGKNERKYTYPVWSMQLGWFLSLLSILWIPGFAIYRILRDRNKGKTFVASLQARQAWCPEHIRDSKTEVQMTSASNTNFPVHNIQVNGHQNQGFRTDTH